MFAVPGDSFPTRKWPAITLALCVLCAVGTTAVRVALPSNEERVQSDYERILEFRTSHPHVRLPPSLDPSLNDTGRALRLDIASAGASLPPDREEILDGVERADQEELDGLVRSLVAAYDASPSRRFGFVPASTNLLGLATYAFVQPGWLELIVAGWFLWSCGCALEHRWGRWVYLGVFAVAVAGAAFAQKAFGPALVPLLGMQGALAALVTATLVSLRKTRLPFVTPVGAEPIRVPAWVLAILWLVVQGGIGLSGLSDVQPFAQLGGIALGGLAAVVLRATGLDAPRASDDQPEYAHQDERVAQAAELVGAGRPREAIDVLRAVEEAQPSNIDVQLEMLRAAKAAGDRRLEMVTYGRLIELYMRTGATNTAMELYLEVKSLGRVGELDGGDCVRAADRLMAQGRLHDAAEVYAGVHEAKKSGPNVLRALIGHARAAASFCRVAEARELLEEAKRSPLATEDWKDRIEKEIAKLPPPANN